MLTVTEKRAAVAAVAKANPTMGAVEVELIVDASAKALGLPYLATCRSQCWDVGAHIAANVRQANAAAAARAAQEQAAQTTELVIELTDEEKAACRTVARACKDDPAAATSEVLEARMIEERARKMRGGARATDDDEN